MKTIFAASSRAVTSGYGETSAGPVVRRRGRAAVPATFAILALFGWGLARPALAASGPAAALPAQFATPAGRRLVAWRALVHANATGTERIKLEQVNAFFNRLHYLADSATGRGDDEWATPREFLLRNAGDCEDFALAKYFTLRDMGVPAGHLRLMYVRTRPRDAAHMVLTYRRGGRTGEILVLDNLRAEILPLSQRRDLLPVYSFNASGLWLPRRQGQAFRVGSAERLSRWQDVLRRLRHLPGGLVY